MANRRGSMEVVTGFLFLGSKITVDGDCSHETRRWLLLGRKAMTDLGSVLKNRDVTLPTNVRQGCGLPSGHVWLWELGHKEGRASTNWRLQTMALEKTLEGPLDSKDITPVNLKGEQPWILIGRTDAGAPGLWSSDANNQLVAKVPSAGKDWVQKDKRVSEDETAGWHHQVWTWANSRRWSGPETPVCCSPWGLKESDMTGQLNNNNDNDSPQRSSLLPFFLSNIHRNLYLYLYKETYLCNR